MVYEVLFLQIKNHGVQERLWTEPKVASESVVPFKEGLKRQQSSEGDGIAKASQRGKIEDLYNIIPGFSKRCFRYRMDNSIEVQTI